MKHDLYHSVERFFVYALDFCTELWIEIVLTKFGLMRAFYTHKNCNLLISLE